MKNQKLICKGSLALGTACGKCERCLEQIAIEKLRSKVQEHQAVQAAADQDAHAMIEAMKSQLLIVLLNRLGGQVTIPVSEIDGTGDFLLSMQPILEAEPKIYFRTTKKN